MQPETRQLTTCRECNASIFFARSPAGARLPLDAAPIEAAAGITNGLKVAYTLEGGAPEFPQAHGWTQLEFTGITEPLYSSHFATCTNPARFSKKPKAARR